MRRRFAQIGSGFSADDCANPAARWFQTSALFPIMYNDRFTEYSGLVVVVVVVPGGLVVNVLECQLRDRRSNPHQGRNFIIDFCSAHPHWPTQLQYSCSVHLQSELFKILSKCISISNYNLLIFKIFKLLLSVNSPKYKMLLAKVIEIEDTFRTHCESINQNSFNNPGQVKMQSMIEFLFK